MASFDLPLCQGVVGNCESEEAISEMHLLGALYCTSEWPGHYAVVVVLSDRRADLSLNLRDQHASKKTATRTNLNKILGSFGVSDPGLSTCPLLQGGGVGPVTAWRDCIWCFCATCISYGSKGS